jgi:hypothetical protein
LPTQLKDGTWALDRYAASPGLHWESMVARIRFREIQEADLNLARVTKGEPRMLTQKGRDAGEALAQLHALLQLGGVAEHNAASLVIGLVNSGNTYIQRLSAIEKFHPTRGYVRIPITRCYSGAIAMADATITNNPVLQGPGHKGAVFP